MLAPPLSTGDGSSVLEGRRHSESKTQTESMQSQLSLCFSASKSRGAVLHSIFFPLFPPTFPVSPSPRIFLSLTSFQNVDFFFFHFQYSRIKRNHLPSCKIPSFTLWKLPNLSLLFWKDRTSSWPIPFPYFHLGEMWTSREIRCLVGSPQGSPCTSGLPIL